MENITTDIKELLDPIPNNWKTQEVFSHLGEASVDF